MIWNFHIAHQHSIPPRKAWDLLELAASQAVTAQSMSADAKRVFSNFPSSLVDAAVVSEEGVSVMELFTSQDQAKHVLAALALKQAMHVMPSGLRDQAEGVNALCQNVEKLGTALAKHCEDIMKANLEGLSAFPSTMARGECQVAVPFGYFAESCCELEACCNCFFCKDHNILGLRWKAKCNSKSPNLYL